jgi:hypothetical protein
MQSNQRGKDLGDKKRFAFKLTKKNNHSGEKDAEYNYENKWQVCLGHC